MSCCFQDVTGDECDTVTPHPDNEQNKTNTSNLKFIFMSISRSSFWNSRHSSGPHPPSFEKTPFWEKEKQLPYRWAGYRIILPQTEGWLSLSDMWSHHRKHDVGDNIWWAETFFVFTNFPKILNPPGCSHNVKIVNLTKYVVFEENM